MNFSLLRVKPDVEALFTVTKSVNLSGNGTLLHLKLYGKIPFVLHSNWQTFLALTIMSTHFAFILKISSRPLVQFTVIAQKTRSKL